MTEPPWRVEVAPVRRADRPDRPSYRGAPLARDDGPGAIPALELIPLSRGRPWDRVLGSILVGAVALALLKPWGAQPVDSARAPATPAPRPAAVASPLPVGPIALPAAVFAPPAHSCMADIGWRICVVGSTGGPGSTAGSGPTGGSGSAGGSGSEGGSGASNAGSLMLRNVFAPNAPPLVDRARVEQADPAVVLATTSGAALAFYPPAGFYTPADSPTDAAIGHPDTALGAAWGTIAVWAWWVEDRGGTQSVDLLAVGPIIRGTQVASNVFVPAADRLVDASSWPAGRYVVWLKGSGVRSWEEFFDFEVIGDQGTTPR